MAGVSGSLRPFSLYHSRTDVGMLAMGVVMFDAEEPEVEPALSILSVL